MLSPCEHSASSAAAGVRSGALRSEVLHEEVLKRYETRMKFHNAMERTFSADGVRATLRAAAAARAKARADAPAPATATGALASIPFVLSSAVDVAGLSTTAGNSALAAGRATRDAPVVEALKRAGAIFFGHANTHEMSLGTTCAHPIHGVAKSVSRWTRSAALC